MTTIKMTDAAETMWWEMVEAIEPPPGCRVMGLFADVARASHVWTAETGWVPEGSIELDPTEVTFLPAPISTASLPSGWRWKGEDEDDRAGDACHVHPSARGLHVTPMSAAELRAMDRAMLRAA
jgi:hypothetical protein